MWEYSIYDKSGILKGDGKNKIMVWDNYLFIKKIKLYSYFLFYNMINFKYDNRFIGR